MNECIVCGCTDDNPCVADLWCETHEPGTCDGTGPSCIVRAGETCGWDIPGLRVCSFCADQPATKETAMLLADAMDAADSNGPLVELVSDGEADRFLRARRAGA
jgi:hypothetical protein